MSCTANSGTCRACLTKTLENYFQFDNPCYFSQNDLTFQQVFNNCTQLKTEPEDGFPQQLCGECTKELQCVYYFQQKVLKTDLDLRKFKENSESSEFKDPLENITDIEDANDNLIFSSNVVQGHINNNNNNGEDTQLNADLDKKNNDHKRFEDNLPSSSPIATTSSDSDDKDNDFLESVETQIFPQGRFLCKLCDKAYFTNIGLEAHREIHMPKRKRQNAKESFRSKSTVKCDNLIQNPGVNQLNQSESEDDNENNKVLVNQRTLNAPEVSVKTTDVNTRKPKKYFPCHVCGKQMISVSKLRYHMVMHTGEKDFLCTMCPNAYSTIYALKHHMRAHTGERPYECKFCGDRFLRPTTLKSHMRRHTGERPYGCDICGKRFIQHSSMATHIKLNHMDKTIACPYCDKKYARQTDLNTHLLSHSGDKPYGCKICPSRFTRQSNLNKHMNQQHPNGGIGTEETDDAAYASSMKISLTKSET